MTPVIAQSDYRLLMNLVSKQTAKETRLLADELHKARIVDDHKLNEHTVRLNSIVEVVNNGKMVQIQIVMPAMADVKNKKLSVLAPLSIALIGFKKNDSFEWTLPAGRQKLEILDVRNGDLLEKEHS